MVHEYDIIALFLVRLGNKYRFAYYVNHARIRSMNQPVLSNEGKETMVAFDGARTR